MSCSSSEYITVENTESWYVIPHLANRYTQVYNTDIHVHSWQEYRKKSGSWQEYRKKSGSGRLCTTDFVEEGRADSVGGRSGSERVLEEGVGGRSGRDDNRKMLG